MPSRRQIREATVQLLYSADLDGFGPPNLPGDAFWDLVAGPDRMRLAALTSRAVLHAAHGQDTRVTTFANRWQSLRPRIRSHPDGDTPVGALDRIAELIPAWSASIASLDRLPKATDDPAAVRPLESALNTVFQHNRTLRAANARFLDALDETPALRGWLEPVTSAARKLQECCDRIHTVEHVETATDEAGMRVIRDSRIELQEWRRCAEDTAQRVLTHLDAIDAEIAETVEHYVPERIDAVDRAILRLATDELLHCDTPTKVVINEAIELAKRFGTSESGRFVNGVLDRIARHVESNRKQPRTTSSTHE
jgi:N utilization substance protein B